jgi:hypothetical protein
MPKPSQKRAPNKIVPIKVDEIGSSESPSVIKIEDNPIHDKLNNAERALLLEYASTIAMVLSTHTSRDRFRKLAAFAYNKNIVSADELGAFGMSDRSTASRWINGQSSPSTLTQSVILERLADKATLLAKSLGESPRQ